MCSFAPTPFPQKGCLKEMVKKTQFSTFPLLHDTYTAPRNITSALYINMVCKHGRMSTLTNVAVQIAAANNAVVSPFPPPSLFFVHN